MRRPRLTRVGGSRARLEWLGDGKRRPSRDRRLGRRRFERGDAGAHQGSIRCVRIAFEVVAIIASRRRHVTELLVGPRDVERQRCSRGERIGVEKALHRFGVAPGTIRDLAGLEPGLRLLGGSGRFAGERRLRAQHETERDEVPSAGVGARESRRRMHPPLPSVRVDQVFDVFRRPGRNRPRYSGRTAAPRRDATRAGPRRGG